MLFLMVSDQNTCLNMYFDLTTNVGAGKFMNSSSNDRWNEVRKFI